MVKIDGVGYSGLELTDSVKQHELYPESWETPDMEEINTLEPGDYAKIALSGSDLRVSNLGGERFWVQVEGPSGNGGYIGSVQNELIVYDIPVDTPIEFRPENVLSVMRKSEAQYA